MTVLDRFCQGDIRALSRVISFIEERQPGYRNLLGKLYRRAKGTLRVGMTGPPGAGKSTLINGLIQQYIKRDCSVGIVAVDPTSPFTGGALLGDRVRVDQTGLGDRVYFRSMASRGASGGLASSTDNAALALDAFGFDMILIETVGIGQVELDIINSCDTVVVALVPESGDAVQTMKAGLMEIADIFVVNKSDRPGADRIVSELEQAMEMRAHDESSWMIPIVSTVAVSGLNMDHLYKTIGEHQFFAKRNGLFDNHRRKQLREKIFAVLRNRFQREFLDRLAGEIDFTQIVDDIRGGKDDPYQVSDRLFEKYSS
ncbi:MAG: methylmalonyl Co-A mutase-associated GTPase MeaB [Candidatus Zixiibacteriota bacterium]